jgi:hypothetical protein
MATTPVGRVAQGIPGECCECAHGAHRAPTCAIVRRSGRGPANAVTRIADLAVESLNHTAQRETDTAR